MSDRVRIRRLPTGVPGLDTVLGGGLPEFSFNVIAGVPGAGKTTLAQQITFGLASAERPALYFTVMGEPPLKMLRYQQQFSFFDMARIGHPIRYVNLADEVIQDKTLDTLLKRILEETERSQPGVVVVDSFRSIARANGLQEQRGLGEFVQKLAMHLASCAATTFLVGEYLKGDIEDNPLFTVADGLFWLHQSLDRNSMVRKLEITKSRGHAAIPGLHTFRITEAGISVFPRMALGAAEEAHAEEGAALRRTAPARLSTGVKPLDEMLGGGIPPGYSVMLVGPSGSGKSVLTTEFIVEGTRQGETGVVAVFEKRPDDYSENGPSGQRLQRLVAAGQVEVLHTRPLDLSIDEMLGQIVAAVHRIKARRVVIDSLSGFELALAPTFREDFKESLYRMIAVLTSMGVTLMMTAGLEDSYVDLRFGPHGSAFLADVIIMQRYAEIEGRLERVMAVVKVRASAHSKELRLFDITPEGILVGERLSGFRAVLKGAPERTVELALADRLLKQAQPTTQAAAQSGTKRPGADQSGAKKKTAKAGAKKKVAPRRGRKLQ